MKIWVLVLVGILVAVLSNLISLGLASPDTFLKRVVNQPELGPGLEGSEFMGDIFATGKITDIKLVPKEQGETSSPPETSPPETPPQSSPQPDSDQKVELSGSKDTYSGSSGSTSRSSPGGKSTSGGSSENQAGNSGTSSESEGESIVFYRKRSDPLIMRPKERVTEDKFDISIFSEVTGQAVDNESNESIPLNKTVFPASFPYAYIDNPHITSPSTIKTNEPVTASCTLKDSFPDQWIMMSMGLDLLKTYEITYTVRLNYLCGICPICWWADFSPIKEKAFTHRLSITRTGQGDPYNKLYVYRSEYDTTETYGYNPLYPNTAENWAEDLMNNLDDVAFASLGVENSGLTYAVTITAHEYGKGILGSVLINYDTAWANSYANPKVIYVEYVCCPSSDINCPPDEWVGDPYCYGGDVRRDKRFYQCVYPCTNDAECRSAIMSDLIEDCGSSWCEAWSNYCENNDVYKKRLCHDKGCLNAACFDNLRTEKQLVQDCGESTWIGDAFCEIRLNDTYEKLYQLKNEKGCEDSECYSLNIVRLKQDCGQTSYEPWGSNFCSDDDVKHSRTVHYRKCEPVHTPSGWVEGCRIYNYIETETVEHCGSDTCFDSGDSWTVKDYIIDYEGCSGGACGSDDKRYDYCSGDTVYDRQCGTSDEGTPASKNCNDYDTDNCWCTTFAGITLKEVCDDWICSAGACKDSGSDWAQSTWSCYSSYECGTQNCRGTTYKCYRTNAGSWNWATSAESTEGNCDDGYDNDCDGYIDKEDPDCPQCDPEETRLCPKQEGVCAGSYEICTDQGLWPGCDDSTYLAWNSSYENPETSCDGLNNNCDGDVDEGGDALCDDGLYCDGEETCEGVNGCQPGTPVDCSYLDDQCNDGYCNEETNQCEKDSTPYEGQTCDDGLWCNGPDQCQDGSCVNTGSVVDCSDGVSCTDDSCDEENDQCVNTANDTKCDDGLWCNGFETCDAVNDCQAGTPPNCDDGNECTDDVCNEELDKCENPNLDAGTLCGEARDCPEDGCNGYFAEFYPLDGHDSCDGNGNCLEYSCAIIDFYCTDNDPFDLVNSLECGAPCDEDSDCYPYCAGDMRYYSGSCASDCICSYSSEDCNDYDTNNCWCTTGYTLNEVCDDWTCGDGECEDSGSDWTRNNWNCESSNECSQQNCQKTDYICYITNAGSWNWSTSAESTESNCDDGHDNDCDGLTDALDPDCPAPDLTISNLRLMWPPDPKAGEIVSFEFIIKNIGEKRAENVGFRFDTGESSWDSPQPITLDVGGEIYVAYDHTYSNPGTYTVTAIVDPDDQISESNENNNQMSITVVVS